MRALRSLLLIHLTLPLWAALPAHAEPPEAAEATEAAETVEGPTTGDPTAAVAPDKRTGIEEIEITGKQGTQDLQKVPESVSSFSEADILDRGLRNFNDLQYNVPSLFSGGGLTKITLRGVGSEVVGPGIDPGFAVHVNNVFSAREMTGLLDYYDIERVDVFRGPQGTLWGRNSTGGAVNIITVRPVYDFDASGDLEYGYFDSGANEVRVRGMLNIPLAEDKLALRVAALTRFNDGLMEMQTTGQRVTDAQMGTIRTSLRWEPREDVTVDLIGSWFRTDGNGPGQKFDGAYFTPPDGPLSETWPGAGPGYDFTGAAPNPADPYRGTANELQNSDSTVWTATLLADWEAGPVRLDSITGFQYTDFFIHRDQDTSDLSISTLDLTDKSRQVSQEFLINSTWDRPFNYTLGTIYQYDWTPRTQITIANAQNTAESINWTLLPFLGPPFNVNLVDGCPPTCPPVKPPGIVRNDFINALTEAKNHVVGAYGTISLEVVEDLTVSLGGRYSYTYRDWNDQSFSQTYAPALGLLGVQVLQLGLPQTDDWSAVTWKAAADYQLRDEHLLWASVGTGSRAGGFNFSEEAPFKSEHIFAVEAGIKNVFFDDRLIFNLTGFWYDWTDIQIAGVENALPITRNAPSAVSYGVEFDWRALPIDELALNGSFGWLEAFYNEDHFSQDQTQQDYSEPDPTQRALLVNLNGNRLPRSPRFTVSVGAQYSVDIGRWGTIVPRVDFYYRDRIAFRQYDNPQDIAPAYTRTDARLTWRSETGRFWGEIFGRNLENEAVKTNQEVLASIYRVHYYAAPISGGFRIGYNFQGRDR